VQFSNSASGKILENTDLQLSYFVYFEDEKFCIHYSDRSLHDYRVNVSTFRCLKYTKYVHYIIRRVLDLKNMKLMNLQRSFSWQLLFYELF